MTGPDRTLAGADRHHRPTGSPKPDRSITIRSRARVVVLFSLLVGSAVAEPATAQEVRRTWPQIKCDRYRQAWSEAVARGFVRGIGPEFRERHDAFLAGGCNGPHDVCPRSRAEMDLADVMTIAAMNAGTASTFPPFGCPR